MPPLTQRTVVGFALASALISVLLMAARSYYAISFFEPLHGMTRGVEYEPLFSIWKYMTGDTVYTDPQRIPFAASFYNWLFYASYGEVARVILALLALGDEWLPTIARLTSLAASFAGAALTYYSLRTVFAVRERSLRLFVVAVSVFLFFGPLVGFFALATGPDMWPLVFNAAAIHLFIRHYGARPVFSILLVCLFSYLSWGFKQNFAYTPATVGLFLLLRRDWSGAALLSAVMIAAGILTLFVGGATYARQLYFGGSQVALSLGFFLTNLANFAAKSFPLLAAAAVIGFFFLRSAPFREYVRAQYRARPALLIPFLGVAVAGAETVLTSSVVYAAENHYFTVSFFLGYALAAANIWLWRSGAEAGSVAHGVFAAGWAANIAAVSLVLAGYQGVLSVRPYHNSLIKDRACLTGMSEPVFVSNPYLALPWMVPAKRPYVVHYNYYMDRRAGIPKEGGGIGGLLDRGHFASIAIPNDSLDRYDGSDLNLYRKRASACEGYAIYDRRDAREQGGR
ncbi:MAG: hypothetical protein OEY85_01200 [Rhodospirillales bacterium]|nr:hypothetical protein [Rhodospirillales bacterium]